MAFILSFVKIDQMSLYLEGVTLSLSLTHTHTHTQGSYPLVESYQIQICSTDEMKKEEPSHL
jgi:hypothetical protein